MSIHWTAHHSVSSVLQAISPIMSTLDALSRSSLRVNRLCLGAVEEPTWTWRTFQLFASRVLRDPRHHSIPQNATNVSLCIDSMKRRPAVKKQDLLRAHQGTTVPIEEDTMAHIRVTSVLLAQLETMTTSLLPMCVSNVLMAKRLMQRRHTVTPLATHQLSNLRSIHRVRPLTFTLSALIRTH
jgi:hypothetical protein